MRSDDYDCRACGACCMSTYDSGSYVQLEERDVLRLSPHYRRLNVVRERYTQALDYSGTFLATKRTRDGVACVALAGRVGGRVRCLIYDNRPYVCRQFSPGSKPCKDARREAGL